jgi:hypothetical protein
VSAARSDGIQKAAVANIMEEVLMVAVCEFCECCPVHDRRSLSLGDL